jgi:hypothetical protein
LLSASPLINFHLQISLLFLAKYRFRSQVSSNLLYQPPLSVGKRFWTDYKEAEKEGDAREILKFYIIKFCIRQVVLEGGHPENRLCLPTEQRLAAQHTGFVMVEK